MQTRLKQIAVKFGDLKPGDTFYIEGEISIKIRPIQNVSAIDMEGRYSVIRDKTPVVRVQPVAIEGNTVIFGEVSVTQSTDCACESLTRKPCE